jgi:hypothetical protein
VLVGIGLYIRLGILETPVFSRLQQAERLERAPILAVIRQHPVEIALSALARMAEQAPFYIFTAFVFAYTVGKLKVPCDFVLTAVLTASILSFVNRVGGGRRTPRRRRQSLASSGSIGSGDWGRREPKPQTRSSTRRLRRCAWHPPGDLKARIDVAHERMLGRLQ